MRERHSSASEKQKNSRPLTGSASSRVYFSKLTIRSTQVRIRRGRRCVPSGASGSGNSDETYVTNATQEETMPGDPKECRRHAAKCAELAMTARSHELKTALLELSKNWENLAISLEAVRDMVSESGKAASDIPQTIDGIRPPTGSANSND